MLTLEWMLDHGKFDRLMDEHHTIIPVDVVERSSFEAIGQKYAQIQDKLIRGELVELKRGRWIEHEWAEEENGLLISNFECSMCHIWERKKSDFCPNCGADMREGVDPCTE
jgi:hypothetical protein